MAWENTDLALLQNTELFSNLPKDEIDFVISNSGKFRLSKGDVLFSSGERASRFYILTSGEIRVFKPNDDGSEEEMARFTAGDTIGDFDFARGAEYDACAEAAEDSSLIVFPDSGSTIDAFSQEEPRTACNILLNAIVMITERIKSIRKLVLENISWVQELHRRAYEDPGTGLWKQSLITDEIRGVLKDPTTLIMLKPDRFKTLVDSRGHSAGDEAMIKIAAILKNIVRRNGSGWAMRFKSNEVGIIIIDCDASKAEKIAEELSASVADMESVPAQGENPEFSFSATIVWSIWSRNGAEWEELFKGNYESLLENWKDGGQRIIRYDKTAES